MNTGKRGMILLLAFTALYLGTMMILLLAFTALHLAMVLKVFLSRSLPTSLFAEAKVFSSKKHLFICLFVCLGLTSFSSLGPLETSYTKLVLEKASS